MTYRVQGDELATVAEARRELAAEARKVADLLDSQEPDADHETAEIRLDTRIGLNRQLSALSLLRTVVPTLH